MTGVQTCALPIFRNPIRSAIVLPAHAFPSVPPLAALIEDCKWRVQVVGREGEGGGKGFEGDDEGGGGEVEEEERERVVKFRREAASGGASVKCAKERARRMGK